MTEQMFVFVCRDVRKYAFDYRRGEMETSDERKFDEHLSGCAECQGYFARLEGMLDAAAIRELTPATDRDDLFTKIVTAARDEADDNTDRDELFGRIAAEITADSDRPAVAAAAIALVEPDDEVEELTPRRPVTLYVVAALAAGVLLGLGLGLIYPSAPAPPVRERVATAPDKADQPAATVVASPKFAELSSQPPPAGIEDVRVFGTTTASWELKRQGAGRTMNLEEGSVLVEYVPGPRGKMQLVSKRFTVDVTGTIFYATTDPASVGVVEGSVNVVLNGDQTVSLGAGDEWVEGVGTRRAAPAVRKDVGLHIDVEAHDDALQKAKRAPRPVEEAPKPAVSREVVVTPRAALRESAERALRDGRYEVAAQYYERMVEELPATEPGNASLRLDLARIYIRHLNQQRRALVHLRTFVADRPDDPLRPAATEELCRIATAVGSLEAECVR